MYVFTLNLWREANKKDVILFKSFQLQSETSKAAVASKAGRLSSAHTALLLLCMLGEATAAVAATHYYSCLQLSLLSSLRLE